VHFYVYTDKTAGKVFNEVYAHEQKVTAMIHGLSILQLRRKITQLLR